MSKYSTEYIKKRTQEIYDSMPQEKEARKACKAQLEELIELNYAFFGYIASHTFINNSSIDYEDKLQSALFHFTECFWWYKWKGDETHKAYRDDLSFTVFFKPRIGEMIERELNEVKYSTRRALCMEVAAQLGKHWGQVTYEDLEKVNLPADKMNSLKAIFGSMYVADLSEHEAYLTANPYYPSIAEDITDKYDSVEDLLYQEMIDQERKLTDSDLKKMSEMYSVDLEELKAARPIAEEKLHARLTELVEIRETF